MSPQKLPALDADNRAFWTRGMAGELAICHCERCRRFVHPPLPVCPDCGDELQARVVSGHGRVVTCSVNHQPWLPGQAVPFVLAVVELREQAGLWLTTNIVGCRAEAVHIDMPVRVRFEHHEDVWLPLFEPEVAA